MEGRSFEQEIELDKFKLHEEATMQALLMAEYSDALAKAKTEKDAAELRVKMAEATANLDYRQNPPEGLKITEAVIEALVITNTSVVAAKEALIKAKEAVYAFEVAVDALRDKSSMIKVLTSLWIGGYYAAPGETPKKRDDVL
jgi:hypothetical protein